MKKINASSSTPGTLHRFLLTSSVRVRSWQRFFAKCSTICTRDQWIKVYVREKKQDEHHWSFAVSASVYKLARVTPRH